MIADGKLRGSPLNSLIQVAKQPISLQRVDMQITRQICYYLMFNMAVWVRLCVPSSIASRARWILVSMGTFSASKEKVVVLLSDICERGRDLSRGLRRAVEQL